MGLASLFFNESIKELIKKFFSAKNNKQINALYLVVLLLAIILPFTIFYLASDKVNKAKLGTEKEVELIQPTKLK